MSKEIGLGDPGAYTSASTFVKSKKLSGIKDIAHSLSKIRSYSLHRSKRKRFQRRALITKRIREIWASDLIQLTQFSKQNKSFGWQKDSQAKKGGSCENFY